MPKKEPKFNGYDYRKNGVVYADGTPRSYQPRKGGPPLLFATDIRMTILVNLALAPGTVRQLWLWKHMGKSSKTALYPLVERGLVVQWSYGGKKFVALDPCHPAAPELRRLLEFIGRTYGFKAMPMDVDAKEGGDAPTRPSRRRDVRNTFGDRLRTLPLLLIYILGKASGEAVGHAVPYLAAENARPIMYMFEAFGLLNRQRMVAWRSRSQVFSFNESNQLVPYIVDVLAALDRAMPQWRIVAERQAIEPPPTRYSLSRKTRRKVGRWKW